MHRLDQLPLVVRCRWKMIYRGLSSRTKFIERVSLSLREPAENNRTSIEARAPRSLLNT